MKVLFSVRPYRGHLHPIIPLARAFFQQGHQVAVATGEDAAEIVIRAGLPWIPAGMSPRQASELSDRSDPDYGLLAVKAKVEDLLECAFSEFRPDILIRDPTDIAAVIAAEVLGASNGIYGLSRFIPIESWHILGADRTLATLRRQYRLPPDPELSSMFSGLYLRVIPALLESVDPLPVEMIQPVAYIPWDADPPAGWKPPPKGSRPRVMVTLGTVYNSDAGLFRRFLESLADAPIDVLCALGDGADPLLAEGLPDNIRCEEYLPFSRVLPSCDAILCHGGFNTVMSALLAGVPPVIVPLGSDHEFNAYICRREGMGVWVEGDNPEPEVLRAAVLDAVSATGYRRRISAFQAEMKSTPSLVDAVRRFESLMAGS